MNSTNQMRRLLTRKQVGTITILLAIVALILCVFLWQPLWLFHRQDFRNGDLVVKRIETFRAETGRLPDSLEELGKKNLPDQIYYQRTDAQNYEVWFSTALGESEIYESHTSHPSHPATGTITLPLSR